MVWIISYGTNPWLVDSPLCVSYSRLYDLAMNKSISVEAMYDLGREEGGAAMVPSVVGMVGNLLGECKILFMLFLCSIML